MMNRGITTSVSKYLIFGLLLMGLLFSLHQVSLSGYFPIKSVRVYGVNRLDQEAIKQALLPLIDRGFFSVNVETIRDRLLQMPWVSDIFVRRSWPDQVDVTVLERRAVAKWNGSSLLSDTGEVFLPATQSYPSDLPNLVGPDAEQVVMLKYFLEMNRLLQPLRVKIASLELTTYLTWKLTLDNGIKMELGHKDSLTRLAHFVKVYPKIIGTHPEDIDSIDLRYANGAAVRWKKPDNGK